MLPRATRGIVTGVTGFRFSFTVFGLGSPAEFAATCRYAEQHGFDAVYTADHLGTPSPFPTLVAAAAATRRLRVGTLVLNAAFWNPALLAREIATTDVLTDGRLEVGLGSGHMKWEFDAAGIPFEGFGRRTVRLAETIEEVGRILGGDGYPEQAALREAFGLPVLRPLQRRGFDGHGPPLIVGGTGDRILRLAAERADIVSVAGAYQVAGAPPGTFRIGSASEIDARVQFARACAGTRADQVEWHTLVQAVVVTEDRQAAAERLARQYGMAPTLVLGSPLVLIGTVDEIAAELRDNHARYGFTHITVHEPFLRAFAPVIERLRAQ